MERLLRGSEENEEEPFQPPVHEVRVSGKRGGLKGTTTTPQEPSICTPSKGEGLPRSRA